MKAILKQSVSLVEWFGDPYYYGDEDVVTFEQGEEVIVLREVRGNMYVIYSERLNESTTVSGGLLIF